MGIVKLPRIEFYWSLSHPYLVTPGISNVMSRVRFEQIFRFLHLCNNKAQVSRGMTDYSKSENSLTLALLSLRVNMLCISNALLMKQ